LCDAEEERIKDLGVNRRGFGKAAGNKRGSGKRKKRRKSEGSRH